MKKTIAALLCILCLTGCTFFKKDTMENINISTTIYPVDYITNVLYGDYSTINSIYPNGINIQIEPNETETNTKYTLTDKQLTDYSNADLFIFNSLLYEGKYVETLFENNKNLKIINANDHLANEEFYGLEELWLDPSRMLTLSRNIKNGFGEYISNYYINQDIQTNFDSLKEELDKLGSKLSGLTKKANNKIIVVNDDVFKFLSKDNYGLTVYSLEENENLNEKTINTVKSLINDGTIKYIYVKQYDPINNTIQNLIQNTNVEIIELHMITNLTETEKNNKKDYFTLMNDNIELLKKGLYN